MVDLSEVKLPDSKSQTLIILHYKNVANLLEILNHPTLKQHLTEVEKNEEVTSGVIHII